MSFATDAIRRLRHVPFRVGKTGVAIADGVTCIDATLRAMKVNRICDECCVKIVADPADESFCVPVEGATIKLHELSGVSEISFVRYPNSEARLP